MTKLLTWKMEEFSLKERQELTVAKQKLAELDTEVKNLQAMIISLYAALNKFQTIIES